MNEQESKILLKAMEQPDQIASIKVYVEETAKIDEQLLQGLNDKNKTYEKCWSYISSKAKDHLNSKSGHVMPSVVFGWAIHYFTEKQEIIDKEFKIVAPKESKKKKDHDIKKVTPKKEVKKEFEVLSMFDFGVDE